MLWYLSCGIRRTMVLANRLNLGRALGSHTQADALG
jgi:hypothetical protein